MAQASACGVTARHSGGPLKVVYLSLGSNLGDRAANLAAARQQLEHAGVHLLRASSLYETEPQGLREQPWFLNQVVQAETGLFPRQLLLRLKKIERALGRKAGAPNGPRVIDLDILLFGDRVVKTADLEIPHPRLAERRFVLEPLAEIAPFVKHPGTGEAVSAMLARITGQKVRKHPGP